MTQALGTAVGVLLLMLLYLGTQSRRWENRALLAERELGAQKALAQASDRYATALGAHLTAALERNHQLVDRITDMQQIGFQVVPTLDEGQDDSRSWSARDADRARMDLPPLTDDDRVPPGELRRRGYGRPQSS